MNTPDPTNAINYQPSGTSPNAAQAGNDVNSQGEPTVDGAIGATAGSGPMTGAFVDNADSAADGASVYSGGLLDIAANNYYGVQQTTGDGNIGLGAVGAAVSVTSIHNNTQAYRRQLRHPAGGRGAGGPRQALASRGHHDPGRRSGSGETINAIAGGGALHAMRPTWPR